MAPSKLQFSRKRIWLAREFRQPWHGGCSAVHDIPVSNPTLYSSMFVTETTVIYTRGLHIFIAVPGLT